VTAQRTPEAVAVKVAHAACTMHAGLWDAPAAAAAAAVGVAAAAAAAAAAGGGGGGAAVGGLPVP